MNDPHNRVTAILEYSPRLKKAFIRAVLEYGERLPPLEPENTQNHVDVFFGADMRFGVGISPLVVEEDLPENVKVHTPLPARASSETEVKP